MKAKNLANIYRYLQKNNIAILIFIIYFFNITILIFQFFIYKTKNIKSLYIKKNIGYMR